MITISPDFISGFVTGEGCFYAESGFDIKYRLKHRIRIAFCIELKEDDCVILEEIQYHLRCGNIYKLDFGRYRDYRDKNWRNHVKYRVSNFQDIMFKVIPFFHAHPLYGVKQKAFVIFSKIAEAMYQKKHLDENGLCEIKMLVSKLKTLNKKGK